MPKRQIFFEDCHRCGREFEAWFPTALEVSAEKMASGNALTIRLQAYYDQVLGCGKDYTKQTPLCKKCLGKILKWWGEWLLEEAQEDKGCQHQ